MHISRRMLLNGCAALPFATTSARAADPITLQVGSQSRAKIARNFMGLGYEASSVALNYLLSANNHSYVRLVRNLGRFGVIRVGGNVSDFSSYDANARSSSNPKATILSRENLRQLNSFLDATGWKLIWGLNLGGDNLDNMVEEARAVVDVTGRHLLAIQVGNEPDLFAQSGHRKAPYGYDAWLADYRRYKAALRAVMPHVPLAGPDVAHTVEWFERFARDEGQDAVLLTAHHYITGQANPATSIALMLQEETKYQPLLARMETAAEKVHRPYRLCETASFSGGGRAGVSDTFAAALWALDYLYVLTSYGCSGVNMETGANHLGWISHYTPIGDDLAGHYSAAPEYYGLLAFAQAGAGELLSVRRDPSEVNLTAYAVRKENSRILVTVINKDFMRGASVKLTTPSQIRHAQAIRLTAPSLSAKTGVTLGGSSIHADGSWSSGSPEQIKAIGGNILLEVPAGSAALVSLLTGP